MIERPFDSAEGFAQALREVLDQAEAQGCRRLVWVDPDFADWPLGEAAFVEALTRWARAPGVRELLMLAADFEGLRRRAPRFVTWRRDWGHRVQCLQPEAHLWPDMPGLWLDGNDQLVRVIARDPWRGRAGTDRHDRQLAREQIDELMRRASPAFSSTTLGL